MLQDLSAIGVGVIAVAAFIGLLWLIALGLGQFAEFKDDTLAVKMYCAFLIVAVSCAAFGLMWLVGIKPLVDLSILIGFCVLTSLIAIGLKKYDKSMREASFLKRAKEAFPIAVFLGVALALFYSVGKWIFLCLPKG